MRGAAVGRAKPEPFLYAFLHPSIKPLHHPSAPGGDINIVREKVMQLISGSCRCVCVFVCVRAVGVPAL